MKATVMFRDQVNTIGNWFEQWNECERTVALYSLCGRLDPSQARFLTRVLEHLLSESSELPHVEQQANNPAFVSSLGEEPKETAIVQLLRHLPLLSPGNQEAKEEYLRLVPQVLADSMHTGSYLEESRQLLSYLLIHPALTPDDRYSINLWLHHLDVNKMGGNGASISVLAHNGLPSYGGNAPRQGYGGGGPATADDGARRDGWKGYAFSPQVGDPAIRSPPRLPSDDAADGGDPPHGRSSPFQGVALASPSTANHHAPYYLLQSGNDSFHARVRRSNSLTPPGGSVQATPIDEMPPPSKPRSMSLSSEHAPLSPQSSLASSGSGSESHLEEPRNSFNAEGSGMKDVPAWLKSLRLHKYAHLFAHMTYEEMLDLTEDRLENVTKGARHKIILSIQKLKERQRTLMQLEKDVVAGGNLRSTLNELKAILSTPIKNGAVPRAVDGETEGGSLAPCDGDSNQVVVDGDLVGQFVRVVGKVCTNLLFSDRPDDENFNQFLLLVDKCVAHEAFTETQKKRLLSWKQEVQKIWHPLPPRRGSDVRHNRGRWNGGHPGNTGNPNGGGYVEYGSVGGGGLPILTRRRVSGPFVLQGGSSGSQGHGPSPKHTALSALEQLQMAHRTHPGLVAALYAKRPSLQDIKSHGALTRTKSAPVRPDRPLQLGKLASEPVPNDPEINTRLESLCLSVTEHALGSLG